MKLMRSAKLRKRPNGMFNSLRDADASKEALKKIFGDKFAGYDLAYNTNKPLLLQLLQVLDQKSAALANKFWLILNDFSQAPPDVNHEIATILKQRALAQQYVKDSDLQADIQKFKETLDGENVLVVAHSQGNFYANQSLTPTTTWQAMVPTQRFSLIG